jgi:carboxyl-terminal processing protease
MQSPYIMKIFFRIFLFFVFTAPLTNAFALKLAAEQKHMLTTIEVIEKLQSHHYEKIAIDDRLSQQFLESYLDMIDPGRQTFQQKDIDAFNRAYKTTLDDYLKKGDVTAGYTIFNLFSEKTSAQLEQIIKNMPETIKGFNFNVDETIEADRSKSPWPASNVEVNEIWRKRLKASVLSLRLTNKPTEKIIELLTKRYQNQLDRLNKMNSEDVYQLYINAFTQLYDPHTNYLSPATSENFDISMSLKLEGIGAMLGAEDEYTKVVRLIPAGPADKQGALKPSDKVIGVGQGKTGDIIDVLGWRLDDVVDLIRGPKGTIVRLQVIPANAISEDETKIITITRDEVKLEEQSVQKAMIDVKDSRGLVHKIGVLDIPAFYIDFEALRNRDPNYKSTTGDTKKLLSELIQEGAEGIIIDLRENGGGSLREANELTGLFIDKGPSVQIRLSDKRIYTEAKNFYSPYYDGPVVVLVNRMSASASEIFAAAMQDYQRAIIVGSRTFGKGTVQSLTPMNHGKLKITESKFYRISGESTQDRGVFPNIALPNIYNEELIGESALEHAMKWDAINPAPHKKYNNFSPIITELQEYSNKRAANDPDFVYLNKQITYDKSLDLKTISLNEKKRIIERTKDREYRLKLINEKRKSKGEDLLKTLDPEKDENEDGIEDADPDAEFGKIDIKDPFLIESAYILLDSDTLLNKPKIAK